MRAHPRGWKRLGRAATLAVLAVAGCADGVLEPRFDERLGMYVVRAEAGGLVQTVRLSHVEPRPGDTLRIQSTVVNRGEARTVESRTCGLELRTELDLKDPFFRCGAYSMRGRLASGDSLRSGDAGVVRSEPGRYRVRLLHLLDPELWITLELTVGRL